MSHKKRKEDHTPTPKDATVPEGKWAFDAKVTAVFEDMLRRSIPGYDAMREIVYGIGKRYVQPDTAIVDLGCSRGDALVPFITTFGERNNYFGVEISEPMWSVARERFQGLPHVKILRIDLRNNYPDFTEKDTTRFASLTLGVLTIQFTPIERRQRILSNIFHTTVPGGAYLHVEKILGEGADIDDDLVSVYYDHKREQGYTEEQIQTKRESLEGVLVPLTAYQNECLLRDAGFDRVECIWRHLNFAAWLAVKEN